MKFSTCVLLITALACPSLTTAFSPASASDSIQTALQAADVSSEPVVEEEQQVTTTAAAAAAVAPAPLGPTINGWTPDADKPCYGLPGAIEPLGYFDPLGFCKNRNLVGVKRFREAEIVHGRVAMMATVGYLVGENTPTIAYGFNNPTIANNQIPEIPLFGLVIPLFVCINYAEAARADIGWVEPSRKTLFTLRDQYYPGDVGFDPLGLKPKQAENFASMQAKELSNGRLAMIAVAGMCVQELVNGNPVLADIPFL